MSHAAFRESPIPYLDGRLACGGPLRAFYPFSRGACLASEESAAFAAPFFLQLVDVYANWGKEAPKPCTALHWRKSDQELVLCSEPLIQIPTQGRRAGVSSVLGACLPWGSGGSSSELFCGGLGGWSSAAKLFRNIQTVLALDVDLDATSWNAKNHDGILLDSGSWGEVQTAA